MARVNKSRHAILGLLTMGPASGYDLHKRYGQSLIHFWSESYGQIYPILRALAAEGLVQGRRERAPGRPERMVYTISEAGRAELREWLALPAEPAPPREEFLLKLFFGRQVGVDGAREQVEDLRQRLRGEGDHLAEIERWLRSELSEAPDLPYWLLTVSYGRRMTEALLDWCEEALPALERMPPASAGPARGGEEEGCAEEEP